MEEEKKEDTVVAPVVDAPTEEDAEAKFARLEAEKAKAIEAAANWKIAAMKERSKHQEEELEDDDDTKMERIARKVLADSQIAQIAVEQDQLIKGILKENKELKLVNKNKQGQTPAAAVGTHVESTPVTDTLVTPDQIAAFKARGWTDKDIEKYKKNLQRYGGR